MSKQLLVLALLFPLTAWADPAATTTSPLAPAPSPSANQTPPQSQSCDGLLPEHAAAFDQKVTALVSFRLTLGGDVRDATLYMSSGNAAFDQAAVACLGRQKWPPATSNGVPVEIIWVRAVHWEYGSGLSIADVSPDGIQHSCPDASRRRIYMPESGDQLLLSYAIGVDGRTKNIRVVRSSSIPDMDRVMVDCVLHWQYLPAESEHRAIEIDQKMSFVWRYSTYTAFLAPDLNPSHSPDYLHTFP